MKYLSIHHTAVNNTGQSQLLGVNRYHKDKWNMLSKLGWYGGYNFFMDQRGKITQFREVGEETMAQKGHNFDTISICLQGNFNADMPTEAQIDSLRAFIKEKVTTYGVRVKLHRELQYRRTCPGKLFTRDYLETVVLKAKEIKPDKPDAEKAEKIKQIQDDLNRARTLLEKLVALIKEKYGKNN